LRRILYDGIVIVVYFRSTIGISAAENVHRRTMSGKTPPILTTSEVPRKRNERTVTFDDPRV